MIFLTHFSLERLRVQVLLVTLWVSVFDHSLYSLVNWLIPTVFAAVEKIRFFDESL